MDDPKFSYAIVDQSTAQIAETNNESFKQAWIGIVFNCIMNVRANTVGLILITGGGSGCSHERATVLQLSNKISSELRKNVKIKYTGYSEFMSKKEAADMSYDDMTIAFQAQTAPSARDNIAKSLATLRFTTQSEREYRWEDGTKRGCCKLKWDRSEQFIDVTL